MTARIDSRIFLATVAVIAILTGPASVRGDGDNRSTTRIEGTWALKVPGSGFQINRTFFANGTNVDASTFPPIPFTSEPLILSDGHGAWERTGPGRYAVTLLFFQLDPATGFLHSYGKVRETVRIRKGVYTGVFETDFFLPNGTLNSHVSGTTEGVLIPAEPAP